LIEYKEAKQTKTYESICMNFISLSNKKRSTMEQELQELTTSPLPPATTIDETNKSSRTGLYEVSKDKISDIVRLF